MSLYREQVQLRDGEAFRVLKWNRDVSSVEVVFGSGKLIPIKGKGDHWHYHPASELTLVQKGSGTRMVGDNIELFEADDMVFIGPNVPHYWHMQGNSTGMAIQWDFPMEHGIWHFPESKQLQSLMKTALRGLHLFGPTNSLIQKKMESLLYRDGFTRLGTFFQIIGLLTEAPKRDYKLLSDQPFSLPDIPETQELIRRAVSYIIAHFREPIHLADLLHITGMSRATFSRQFLLYAGKSFSNFLNQVRLKAVCRELVETRESISNIAFENGFNQLSFFNRLFLREMGVSPSAYRKANWKGGSKVQSTQNPFTEDARDL